MDNIGLQPPIIPPTTATPAPEPIKEEPMIPPPLNPAVKKSKKFLPRLALGSLVMALLIGGLVLGKNLTQEKQRPVEKLAEGGVCGNRCDVWYCPNNDTNDDDECNGEDEDAYIAYSGTECADKNLGYLDDNCGQVDYIDASGDVCDNVQNVPGCSTDNFFDKCVGAEQDMCKPRLCQSGNCADQCSNDSDCQGGTTVSCVGLTKDKAVPNLDDQVTFSCEASFSGGSPVAYFRYRVDDLQFNEDPTAYPIDPATHRASKLQTIAPYGNWVYQCKVCTDSTPQASCTAWGEAN